MSRIQEPADLNQLYTKALELHQNGQPDEAINLYIALIEHVPEVPEIHYNLGLAFFETEQFDSAANAYTKAAELHPGDADILYNLGLAYKKGKQFVQAENAYLKALKLAPADGDIIYNLGCCYRDAGEIEQARTVFNKLVKMEPDYLPALNNLAYLHHLVGEYDQAREAYEQILTLDPEHASAGYMHSVLIGAPVDVPPQEYIRSLFDHYSETFEENLIEDLEYNLFLDLKARFDSIKQKKRIYAHGLDLGCGTGLAGEAFRTACVKLSGVDLSAKMIEQAENKQIYTALHVEDIVAFLETTETEFDLFVAADVLIYRGELDTLFKAAARRSSHDALFCLSIEKSDSSGWTVQPTGRYAHHPDYIRKTAMDNGWVELISEDNKTRREGESWVTGTIFILARKS